MEHVTIRAATPEDAWRLLAIYAPYVRETAITFEYEVPTAEAFRERIRHTQERYPYLVLEEDGQPMGYAYAGAFHSRAAYDWSCELSVYLAREARGKGYGRALYAALEEALAGMGIQNVYACIAYPETPDEYLNTNSADFHAHLGFHEVGRFHRCAYKFGRWYDMIWMEKLIGTHPAEAQPVRFGGME